MKSKERARLSFVLKDIKKMGVFSSAHWEKVTKLEQEQRTLMAQIIKDEKLLSEGIFSFRIDTYVRDRSCALHGPTIYHDMKKLGKLIGPTDHFSLDIDEAYLTVGDGDVYINIHKLKDVQKVIDNLSLKVTFKNLEEERTKIEEDLKMVKGFIKKLKGGEK